MLPFVWLYVSFLLYLIIIKKYKNMKNVIKEVLRMVVLSFVILVILKLGGIINWSWWLVCSGLIGSYILVEVISGILLLKILFKRKF
jgi:hypothetical protein